MKIGIIGLSCSGKTTIFNALTGQSAETSAFSGAKREPNLAEVNVPDERLYKLSSMYNPKKTTPAKIQYVDIAGSVSSKDEKKQNELDELLNLLRPADALLHVVRNFELAGQAPEPQKDFEALESELILTDLITVEKRLERLEKESKKGKKPDPEEYELLKKAKDLLDKGIALRGDKEICSSKKLRGFTFLSAKPTIVVLNTGDDIEIGTTKLELPSPIGFVEIKGKLEMEIMQLDPEDAEIFRNDLGLDEPATTKLIQKSYELLGLISFFTVGEDEVRAWTITQGTKAQKAAGVIHSDIEKGFIRAEVVSYDDLINAGSYHNAQKQGKVRLEGKDYIVQDGDVIQFRFNV